MFLMPNYWLISDRDRGAGGIGTGGGRNDAGLTYFVSDKTPLNDISNWNKVSPAAFRKLLADAADRFPALLQGDNESQSHVSLLIHGFNVSFDHSTQFYQDLCGKLYDGPESLGLCILYDWPSCGNLLGYYPDRQHARICANDLTDILAELYDWLLGKQQDAIRSNGDPDKACKAKVSVIAHSMGNYVVQKAMTAAWTRTNQPLLASLINQLVMVAADVDNNLFDSGAPDNDDGAALAYLTYRVTALYSGRDAVLAGSAGLKHFGARRLGRSGLAHYPPLVSQPPSTDNVWGFDCSRFFSPSGFNLPGIGSGDIHRAYFAVPETIELMRQILRGIDRGVLTEQIATVGKASPP